MTRVLGLDPCEQQWLLRFECRPWTLNIERQGNKWKRAKLVAEWRKAFGELATEMAMPRFLAVRVSVRPTLRNRSAMPDTGACIGAAKAAIDGLVDAGVLDDDGPDQVIELRFYAPVVDGRPDALELTVTEAAA